MKKPKANQKKSTKISLKNKKTDVYIEQQLRSEEAVLKARLVVVEGILREINLRKLDSNLTVEERIRIRQETCKHRKGGRHGNRSLSVHVDYAIKDFTFIDGRREVSCLICSKKWRPNERDWDKALLMLEQTTNTSSSSEHLATVSPFARTPIQPHSVAEIKDANRPRNLDEENPIRGRKFNK